MLEDGTMLLVVGMISQLDGRLFLVGMGLVCKKLLVKDFDGTKLLVVCMTFLVGVVYVCKKHLVKDLNGTKLLVVGVTFLVGMGLACK